MYRIYLATFLLFSLVVSSSASGNSYVVMSSTDSTVKENIDIADLRDIFLGNRLFWRNGERIFPAHIPKETQKMKVFLNQVLSMSPRKFNKHWRRRLFSGKGHPPLELDSDRKTIDYVKTTNGAIGVIGRLPKKRDSHLFFFKPSNDGHSLKLTE